MKKFVVLGIAAAVIGWGAWPYYTVHSIGAAVRERDVVALERLVDWNGLRAGFRDDLKAVMAATISRKGASASGGEAALGMGIAALLGPAIIDRAVDAYVTPQGLSRLIEDGRAPSGKGAAAGSGGTSGKGLDWSRVKYAFFTGPTDFRLDVAGDKPGEGITMTMRWDGGWKLNRVFLPVDQITGAMR